ncbi:acyltransferase [Clostridium carboxidivorans P7]|uniref:Acyltransferase 3 n=1 Tax=Clostridium carboxidivorans P7 TaxID=536227 RepID=C6PNT1_9CLOT|nr:acyltransferase family protein [Clostridium carboxidivorans]AKN31311.1 acyltransferase [Clostridium carboxidivorans P7]EET89009.1 acyltransferase 3 [Clostridium carboxidivorans P7]
MGKTTRRYDIDWLRTIGVLMVIPFHSLLIFNMQPWSIVYIKDTINVRSFNILDSIIDRFHMPLLFVIAGMSVYFSIQSRTSKQFINERVKKLLIPAIFGCIMLNPIMTYIYLISKNENSTFINHFIDFFTKNPGDFVGLNGGFTPAHLWFIIFLFAFSLVGMPLFIKLSDKSSNSFISNLASFFEKPLMLILAVVPFAIASIVDILGDKNPLAYFVIFFIGFLLATDERYQKAINRDKWIYLLLSIILIYIRLTIGNRFELWSGMWIIYGLMDRATKLVPVFALLGLGNSYMNKNAQVLEYLSKASFPIYVIHMLINTIVGFFVIKLTISAELKYVIIVTITFVLCFLLYEIIKRIKFLRFIFAIKPVAKNANGINKNNCLDI